MKLRLSAMMFLQYWPLGVWGVTVGTYIAANTGEEGLGIFSAGFVGYSTAAGAIGSMLAPVVIGFLSDKYYSARGLLALMNLICVGTAWGMYHTRSETFFFCWLLGYFHAFLPAVTLTNKISLCNLKNAEVDYPFVRIFGTLGWISAGLFVGWAWPSMTGESIEATATPLLLGAGGHVLMAIYSLTLPHTSPEHLEKKSESSLHTLRDGQWLRRNRALIAFLMLSVLACIPSMAYNNYANLFLNRSGYSRPAALMTLGQASDLLCLFAAPWAIKRIGLKTLFAAGLLAWSLRYGLLALGSYFTVTWPTYVAILIHGPCYVFIYVVGVMYVDRLAHPAHRGAAQGFNALATTGLGHLFGALAVGMSQQYFLTPAGVTPAPYDWTPFWLVPAVLSLITLALFKLVLGSNAALHEVSSAPAEVDDSQLSDSTDGSS